MRFTAGILSNRLLPLIELNRRLAMVTGVLGIEPRYPVLETGALPLNYTPIMVRVDPSGLCEALKSIAGHALLWLG